MTIDRSLAPIALLAFGLAGIAGAALPDGDELRLDIDLHDVASRDAMWSLARVLGAELAFDPLLDQEISLELRQVRPLEALDRVCQAIRLTDRESHTCDWRIRRGEEPTLSVGSKALSLELVQAELGSVLFLFGRLIDAGAIEIDPELQARVDLHLENVFWFEALDEVCEQAGCRWRLERSVGAGPRLIVESRGDVAMTQVSVYLAGGATGAASVSSTEIAFALKPFGSERAGAISGSALFVGSERTFRISAKDAPCEAVLGRVFLGGGRTALVPLLLDCQDPPHVTAFDPVPLPLERVWMNGTRRARLELREPRRETATSMATPVPESCVRLGDARVGVRFAQRGSSPALARGAMLVLDAYEPGQVLQFSMPPTADSPRGFADTGIVVLGREDGGRIELGLVTAGSDGSGPVMHRGAIAPGDVWDLSKLLPYDGFVVQVALLAPGSQSWPE